MFVICKQQRCIQKMYHFVFAVIPYLFSLYERHDGDWASQMGL